MPVLHSPDDPEDIAQVLDNLSESHTGAVVGGTIAAFHRSLDVRRTELIEEPLHRSLWNTLKAKKQQYPNKRPFLVVIRPGHRELEPQWILDVLARKVWPDHDFRRITGVLVHLPRLSFQNTCPGNKIAVSLNANATSPASPALLDMLEGRKQFILP
jgi:hypothetical protein